MADNLSLARNPNTSPEVLSRLAEDPDAGVREVVAYNPNTPPEVLAPLAGDAD
jgi:Leucine rich repeat variant